MFHAGVNAKGASYPTSSLGGSLTGTLPSAGLSSTLGRSLSCSITESKNHFVWKRCYDAPEG